MQDHAGVSATSELPVHLLGHFLWWLAGVAIGASGLLLRLFRGHLQWRLSRPRHLTIVAAQSAVVDTGAYARPVTGIGQLRALALIASSLRRAYHDVELRAIYWSEQQLSQRLEGDLILLGGPKNNEITRRALEKIRAQARVFERDNTLYWEERGEQESFEPSESDHNVTSDYGMIVRMANPFSSSRHATLCIFAGGHTYGTMAAAMYFTRELSHLRRLPQLRRRGFAAIVHCTVVAGEPTAIRVVKQHAF